jgi:oxygen-dependent protoporphyrinogen oxidase
VVDAEVEAVVVGAGAAGLAAAHTLRARGIGALVLEAGAQPGGALSSARSGPWLAERGATTARISAAALGLLTRVGVADALLPASPASRLRFLVRAGRLEPLPTGVLSAARTPLLSARGKLRVLAEPFVRRGDAAGESVHEFASRRLGEEASERLVGAFLTGVYAGDERELGAEAVFPRLVAMEREHGSLARGLLAARGGAAGALPGIHSTAEGLGALAAALARPLGEALALGTRAVGLERSGGAWRVRAAGPDGEREIAARRVIVATPAREAAALLEALDAEAAAILRGIEYAPIAALSLGLERAAARTSIEGFGFLVPRAEGLRLLGCLFASRLFPGRAPPGRELLTCMLGGVRWREAVELPDDRLVETARRELAALLGLRGEPEIVALARWPRAVPQPGREHPRLVAALRERVARLSGVSLAGGYLDGVAVADALASGARAAEG